MPAARERIQMSAYPRDTRACKGMDEQQTRAAIVPIEASHPPPISAMLRTYLGGSP